MPAATGVQHRPSKRGVSIYIPTSGTVASVSVKRELDSLRIHGRPAQAQQAGLLREETTSRASHSAPAEVTYGLTDHAPRCTPDRSSSPRVPWLGSSPLPAFFSPAGVIVLDEVTMHTGGEPPLREKEEHHCTLYATGVEAVAALPEGCIG